MANLPFVSLAVLITAGFLWFLRRRVLKSPLDNIPGPPSESFWKGNLGQFFSRRGSEFHKQVAFNYGSVVKLHGLFGKAMLYVSDPKALHHVIIKEEPIFQESDLFIVNNSLVFGPGLLSTLGDHHRQQRKMLNPVFSVAHMRYMLPIFYGIIHKLRDAITTRVVDGPKEIDVLGWMGRAALELIGQGGLGYSFDPLVEDTKDAYGEAIKSLVPGLSKTDRFRRIIPYIQKLAPPRLWERLLDAFPHEDVRDLKHVVDTMSRRSAEIYQAKKVALEKGDDAVLRQVGEGKDIISVLMKANMVAGEGDKLPESEIIAQMSTLIFAGMDTTSNAVSRMLQLLSEHPDMQQKLREEILAAGAGDHMTYDNLNRLPLLDGVCRETLRLYPPATFISRVATKDAIVPLSESIIGTDGKRMSEIHVPKGTEVIVGILASNANKDMWGEDALEWKPERWISPLPSNVTDAPIPGVYANLMTFMGGKRACIGFKFSEMEMKVVLSVMLSSFTFELTEKPIEWNVAGVYYPTVGKISNAPQMPLKLGLYKGAQA